MFTFEQYKAITVIVSVIMTMFMIGGFVQQWKLQTRRDKMSALRMWGLLMSLILLTIAGQLEEIPTITWEGTARVGTYAIFTFVAIMAIWSTKKIERQE